MKRSPKNSYAGALMVVEQTEQEYPLFDKFVKPKQYTGPNVRGEIVTCWGLHGVDKRSGFSCFVRLNSPEEAERFYKEEI